MTRRITRLATGLFAIMLALSFFGRALASAATPVVYNYDFHKSVYPWTAGVACHPEPVVDGPCSTALMLQLGQDRKFGSYAALTNVGAAALWMRSDYYPTGNTMSVQFDAFPVANADRLTPLIYVGYMEPQSLSDFQKIGIPLKNGWQRLGYKLSLPVMPANSDRLQIQMVVAIGFMNLDGAKIKQVGGIDNVRIAFYDR
jgi:hypothetical protein